MAKPTQRPLGGASGELRPWQTPELVSRGRLEVRALFQFTPPPPPGGGGSGHPQQAPTPGDRGRD